MLFVYGQWVSDYPKRLCHVMLLMLRFCLSVKYGSMQPSEMSSHATRQGTLGHSHLSSLIHCGLILT